MKRRKVILVEDSHSGSPVTNEYNFGSAEMGRLLSGEGHKVVGTRLAEGFHPNTGLTDRVLDQFDVVILNGLCGNQEIPFADAEVDAIKNWVHGGGGLLVVSAGPKYGKVKTSSILNPVIKPFGLAFQDRHLEQTKRITKLSNRHPVTRGLRDFYIIHGAPVAAPPPAENIAWVGEDSILAVRHVSRGRMAAFGGGTAFMGQALGSQIIKDNQPAAAAANKVLLSKLVNWLGDKPLEA